MKVKIARRNVVVEHAVKSDNGVEVVTSVMELPKKTKNVDKFVTDNFKGVLDFKVEETMKSYELDFEKAVEAGLLKEVED